MKFCMWFKYGLKAQNFIEAARPDLTVTGA